MAREWWATNEGLGANVDHLPPSITDAAATSTATSPPQAKHSTAVVNQIAECHSCTITLVNRYDHSAVVATILPFPANSRQSFQA